MRSLGLPASAAVAQVFAASVRHSRVNSYVASSSCASTRTRIPRRSRRTSKPPRNRIRPRGPRPLASGQQRDRTGPARQPSMGPSRDQLLRDQDPGRKAGPCSRPRTPESTRHIRTLKAPSPATITATRQQRTSSVTARMSPASSRLERTTRSASPVSRIRSCISGRSSPTSQPPMAGTTSTRRCICVR